MSYLYTYALALGGISIIASDVEHSFSILIECGLDSLAFMAMSVHYSPYKLCADLFVRAGSGSACRGPGDLIFLFLLP